MAALAQLKEILIASIPTFILVWILYAYVTRVFLRPLQAVLGKRREATQGLREKAEAAISQTERRAAEYQDALRLARADIYQMQEQERQTALEERSGILRDAQARAEEMVAQARHQIGGEVDAAKKSLAAEVEQLASAIAAAIVKHPTTEPVGSGVSGSEGGS